MHIKEQRVSFWGDTDGYRFYIGTSKSVTDLDTPEDLEHFSAGELLRWYKNQDGIERNFSF